MRADTQLALGLGDAAAAGVAASGPVRAKQVMTIKLDVKWFTGCLLSGVHCGRLTASSRPPHAARKRRSSR